MKAGRANPKAPSDIASLIMARRATMRAVAKAEDDAQRMHTALVEAGKRLQAARDEDAKIRQRIEEHLLQQIAGKIPLDPDPLTGREDLQP